MGKKFTDGELRMYEDLMQLKPDCRTHTDDERIMKNKRRKRTRRKRNRKYVFVDKT